MSRLSVGFDMCKTCMYSRCSLNIRYYAYPDFLVSFLFGIKMIEFNEIKSGGCSLVVRVWEELMFLNCGAGEDSWESLGLQGDQTSQS